MAAAPGTNKYRCSYHIIGTTRNGNDCVLQDFEFHIIAWSTASQVLLQCHVRRVLKHVEWIHTRRFQIARHAPRLHRLGDILRAASMSLKPHCGIEGRVAGHEGHVVGVTGVSSELENGLLLVRDEAITNRGWCATVEDIACI